jgi:NADPH:quinone reductase-like Zn-dependent oxidoreductase
MKAAVLHAPGPPEAFVIEDIPVPAIAHDEVLVRVLACGVSYKEVVERNGVYKRDVVFPVVLGAEIAGRVEECGAGVADLKIGDIVCTKAFASCGYCRLCRTGRESTCAQRKPVRGGYGEFSAIPGDACVKLPVSISPEVGCSLGMGAAVALNAVRDIAKVALGETVLVTGASGGVGLSAVQLARASGARVIALTRTATKRSKLLEDGASEVVTIKDSGDFSRDVRDLTGGRGTDVVIDTVGSRVFEHAFASLAVHGRYALVGELFGADTSINLARIFFKRASLLGVGSLSRAQLDDAITLVTRGLLRPRIDRALKLSEIAAAHHLVENGQAYGRVVIKM